MQSGRRYTIFQTVNWTKKSIYLFTLYSGTITLCYYFFRLDWLLIPWQPVSLVGIAVAFYLGFKNNSSYERLWEARKIWGGIVNASRTITVMIRDFITNEHTGEPKPETDLNGERRTFVHRHVAWLHALTFQMRVLQDWEHNVKNDRKFRKYIGTDQPEQKFYELKPYLSNEDFEYIMTKGNRASHLLSLQSMHLKKLKSEGLIEDFRHMELENMIKELYALQGKSERIKNFPFPRQYASANYFFVCIFLLLLPFSILGVFAKLSEPFMIWLTIPFTVLVSWVFWIMESIGEYSENPFEGLYNDVPITSMARGIEIDIRQMIEETDLPEPFKPFGSYKILY